MLGSLRAKFASLGKAPRELWLVYTLKLLESYGYFSMSIILVLYLSQEFGLSDRQAGTLYGLYGAATAGMGFAIGFLIDNLGVRCSLVLGFSVSTLARLMLSMTTNAVYAKVILCLVLPVGSALGIPVMTLAIKRYTTSKTRGFAFAIFYVVMNIAALVAGLMVDTLEMNLKGGRVIFGTHFPAKRLILLSGVAASGIGTLLSFFVREIKVQEGYDEEETVKSHQVHKASPWIILNDLFHSGEFWKFMGITLICINLKMIFRYLDSMFPTYLVREFGEDFPKGSIYSINPAMVIVLVPIVAAYTGERTPYSMIHVGSYLAALSVLPMALNTSLGSAIAFVVLLSIGEAIWSPRFYDLAVSMAPEGREGTFVAIATAPMFLATIPVGILSGYCLDVYCPAHGPRHSTTMWLIIFSLTSSAPVLLTVLQDWLRPSARKDV